MQIRDIEDELSELRRANEHNSFEYDGRLSTFCSVCNNHFGSVQRKDKHGVYIIRQRSTYDILRIGKGGTIGNRGSFKTQDILGRLTNVKSGDVSADQWFEALSAEKGPLIIEYVFLTETPISPALAESVLLQAYLNGHGSLPYGNSAF
jgi:hypothetical protein